MSQWSSLIYTHFVLFVAFYGVALGWLICACLSIYAISLHVGTFLDIVSLSSTSSQKLHWTTTTTTTNATTPPINNHVINLNIYRQCVRLIWQLFVLYQLKIQICCICTIFCNSHPYFDYYLYNYYSYLYNTTYILYYCAYLCVCGVCVFVLFVGSSFRNRIHVWK